MSDTWDDGYEESLDDGHEFAERHLSLPDDSFPGEEGGQDFTFDDPRSERLDKGVVPARFKGKCVICEAPIELGDPITAQGINGWRHAGCKGEQVFETQYKKDEKAANDLLEKQAEKQAEKDCEDF
jgi:hypothetical protein